MLRDQASELWQEGGFPVRVEPGPSDGATRHQTCGKGRLSSG